MPIFSHFYNRPNVSIDKIQGTLYVVSAISVMATNGETILKTPLENYTDTESIVCGGKNRRRSFAHFYRFVEN